MIKSFVINLADRPERLSHMQETFGQAGIPFERFDAIGRDSIAAHQLGNRLRRRSDRRPWLPFEIGCLLSHHELWKRIAAGEDAFGAIFEDDILVSDGLRSILDGDFPPDADLVKLETTCQVTYVSRSAIPMKNGNGCFRRLLSIHEGTGAYIVSKHAAGKLADAAFRFDAPLDRSLFAPRVLAREGLAAYQADPAVALQGIFVPQLRDSAAMKSDRLEDFKLAPIVSPRFNPLQMAMRGVVRLWRQARGRRTAIRFAGCERYPGREG